MPPSEAPDAVGLVATLQWLRSVSRSRRLDCPRCPRLVAFRRRAAGRNIPTGTTRRCRSFGDLDARLLIVGLAPGMQRRQPHRPALHRRLCRRPALLDPAEVRLRPGHLSAPTRTTGCDCVDCRIANAVRCLPPENKPQPVEFTACRPFLQAELAVMPKLRVIVALGKGAHDQVLRALTVQAGRRLSLHPRPAARAADRPAAGRQLSLLALQHEHRPADDRDVPRRVSRRSATRLSGLGLPSFGLDRPGDLAGAGRTRLGQAPFRLPSLPIRYLWKFHFGAAASPASPAIH